MAQAVETHMRTIFEKVQFNKTDHPNWIKKLTKLYNKVSYVSSFFFTIDFY